MRTNLRRMVIYSKYPVVITDSKILFFLVHFKYSFVTGSKAFIFHISSFKETFKALVLNSLFSL